MIDKFSSLDFNNYALYTIKLRLTGGQKLITDIYEESSDFYSDNKARVIPTLPNMKTTKLTANNSLAVMYGLSAVVRARNAASTSRADWTFSVSRLIIKAMYSCSETKPSLYTD